MASVFKRGKVWYASFKGLSGWQSRAAGTDRGEALRLAGHWENEARCRREGLIDVKADAVKAASQKPIAEHLADYEADLLAKGCTPRHAVMTRNRAAAVLNAASKVATVNDISPAAVNTAVKALAEASDLSMASRSHYLRAMKLFTRWLAREERLFSDPLAFVKIAVNIAKADRRHNRRAMTREEFALLMRFMPSMPARFGMAAADRAMLYRVAVGTGFRAGELASLTATSFAVDGDEPSITVAAGYSKRGKRSGRDDVQPISAELAAALAAWLPSRPTTGAAFNTPGTTHMAEMLRADLQTARRYWLRTGKSKAERKAMYEERTLAAVDAGGHVLDFHALRHTYVSWLVASGASVKVCQTLARHSTPVLTLNVYTHLSLADHRSAVEALATPKPTNDTAALPMLKTGTDDMPVTARAENMHKTTRKYAQKYALSQKRYFLLG
jgi:integrase